MSFVLAKECGNDLKIYKPKTIFENFTKPFRVEDPP